MNLKLTAQLQIQPMKDASRPPTGALWTVTSLKDGAMVYIGIELVVFGVKTARPSPILRVCADSAHAARSARASVQRGMGPFCELMRSAGFNPVSARAVNIIRRTEHDFHCRHCLRRCRNPFITELDDVCLMDDA